MKFDNMTKWLGVNGQSQLVKQPRGNTDRFGLFPYLQLPFHFTDLININFEWNQHCQSW